MHDDPDIPAEQSHRGMLVMYALLLAAARAQDDLDLLTPRQGESCGYESCFPGKPGWLNVHVVPHTHSELGHARSFHQHFTGEDPPHATNTVNMKRILDAVVTELWNNDRRKFTISDTAYLFHWWNRRHPTVRRMVDLLVRQGRLSIVGGGLGITDEASTSYHAIIDQFTYSLRKLNATFGACARPLVAWAVDVYGHSREFTSLMAQMGFDAVFVHPISYDDSAARMGRRALEFLWRGSDDLGASTDLFTHVLFDGYWAPPGFCFGELCSDPLLATSSQLFSNVERIDKFIEATLYRQAPHYGTRHILVTMGHREAYSDASVWFANIDKLIALTNWKAHQKRLNVTVFYSNPACYLAAVHDENPELETKQDDFFPYVHDKDSYTVGMYSSRPTFKFLIREAHIYLQIAKQLQVTANIPMLASKSLFEEFNWVLGVVQDHGVASGVMRQSVKEYYVARVHEVVTNSTNMISRAFTKLRASPSHVPYRRCQFNISSCAQTRYIKHTIQVYNPLGWPVTSPVRLPIDPVQSKYKVYNVEGVEVKSETIKLPEAILKIKGRPKADHELVFIATNIPPVGFRSYYIEAQFQGTKKTVKRIQTLETKNLPNTQDENDESNEIDTTTQIVEEIQEQKNTRNEMKMLGTDSSKRDYKRSNNGAKRFAVPARNNTSKTGSNAPRTLATMVLRDTAYNNQMRNVIQVESVDNDKYMGPTTEAESIMLPMLRDYLQKENILSKLDFLDAEDEPAASIELSKDEPISPDIEGLEAVAIPQDIEVPNTKSGYKVSVKPTTESDVVPIKANTIESDIRVPFRKRKSTTQEPDIKILIETVTSASIMRVPHRKSTTEKISPELDIKVPVRVSPVKSENKGSRRWKIAEPVTIATNKTTTPQSVLKVKLPVRTTTLRLPARFKSVPKLPITSLRESVPTSLESLAIVPVRTTSTESIVTRSPAWNLSTTAHSVLVVPVKGGTTEALSTLPNTTVTSESPIDTSEDDIKTTTEQMETEYSTIVKESLSKLTVPLNTNSAQEKLKEISTKPVTYKTVESVSLEEHIETNPIVDSKAIETKETTYNGETFISAKLSHTEETTVRNWEKVVATEEVIASTNMETTTNSSDYTSSTDNMVPVPRANNDTIALAAPSATKSTSDEKYFKVDGGSKLFIGNRYVRINLNQRRRVSSVFLSNGIRVNLDIQMFYYIADDPDKFDTRTVPRNTVKPPGAYIFRPLNDNIVRMDTDYKIDIIKTSIVEEIQIQYNQWASLTIRLYVDSPVIEVHWLVGPIPSDGSGRDVFVRYATGLSAGGGFGTDASGRQTVRRRHGARASYQPLDLDPITGNLYPVTSKIYIEDAKRNVRFAVLNDRCQAGGALADGAVDLMLHRRILTDDIGFGAYLNETDSEGLGIRAAGTHYLYLTKADRNRIFEKKLAKEIAMAPRVLASDELSYTDDMKREFYESKNEFSALRDRLPIGVHLLSLERLTNDELLVRFENYLEKADVTTDGVRYVALRHLFNDIRVVWLKETTLAANMYKDQWKPTRWRKKNEFYKSNEYLGSEEGVADELGGRGVRLAPQQIRSFIIKYEYT